MQTYYYERCSITLLTYWCNLDKQSCCSYTHFHVQGLVLLAFPEHENKWK